MWGGLESDLASYVLSVRRIVNDLLLTGRVLNLRCSRRSEYPLQTCGFIHEVHVGSWKILSNFYLTIVVDFSYVLIFLSKVVALPS